MHTLEPYYNWRGFYVASEDPYSPFFDREYSEFEYSQKIYDYYIHPQWDNFGSQTLFMKILYASYDEGFAVIELMGEWNDLLYNDIMFLKRNVVDPLVKKGIVKFVLFCENVLNFHASPDDDYYAEWSEEITEEGGWIALLNTRQHVIEEMHDARLQLYAHFGEDYNDINWRSQKPQVVCSIIEAMVSGRIQRLAEG